MKERKKRSSCAHSSDCNEVFDFSDSANDCIPMSLIRLSSLVEKHGDGAEKKTQ